jgi:hypothetical protein
MVKEVSYFSVAVLFVSNFAWATVWSDDFESYTVGDDLSDYPDWTNGRGRFFNFEVVEYGGSKCICGEWPRYYYEPPGELTDSRVSFDFCFDGVDTRAYALFRYNPDIYEGYIAGCVNDFELYGGDDYLVFGCVFEDADAIYWPFFNLGDYFEEGIWYHLEAKVWGSDEGACYEISVDDDVGVLSQIPDGIPVHYTGYCGVTVYCGQYDNITYVDSFEVDDEVTIGIQPTSLGALKAAFR